MTALPSCCTTLPKARPTVTAARRVAAAPLPIAWWRRDDGDGVAAAGDDHRWLAQQCKPATPIIPATAAQSPTVTLPGAAQEWIAVRHRLSVANIRVVTRCSST